MREFPDLSQEAWDAALEQHQNRYRIPERLTEQQAIEHFSAIGRMALTSLVSRYANKAREKQKLAPIRVKIPQSLTNWIESQIESLDSVSGHLGSRTYSSIANSMLSELRAIEHTFLGHHD